MRPRGVVVRDVPGKHPTQVPVGAENFVTVPEQHLSRRTLSITVPGQPEAAVDRLIRIIKALRPR
jgi:hypothetical protein